MENNRGNTHERNMRLPEEVNNEDSPVIEVMSSDDEEILTTQENNNEELHTSTPSFSCYHCNKKFKNIAAVYQHTKQIPVAEMEVSINQYTSRVLRNRNDVPLTPSKQLSINKKKVTKTKVYCPNCVYSTTQPYLLRCHLFLNHKGLKPHNIRILSKNK